MVKDEMLARYQLNNLKKFEIITNYMYVYVNVLELINIDND